MAEKERNREARAGQPQGADATPVTGTTAAASSGSSSGETGAGATRSPDDAAWGANAAAASGTTARGGFYARASQRASRRGVVGSPGPHELNRDRAERERGYREGSAREGGSTGLSERAGGLPADYRAGGGDWNNRAGTGDVRDLAQREAISRPGDAGNAANAGNAGYPGYGGVDRDVEFHNWRNMGPVALPSDRGVSGRAAESVGTTRRTRWQREPATARDIMTKNPKSVQREANVREIAQVMRDENTGIVPVVEGSGRLLGVVTDRDIVMRALAEGKNPLELRASDVMTDDVEAVTPDESLRGVVELMGNKQIRRVPVVDQNDRLVGIISMADVATRADYDEDLQDALEEISAKRSFWSGIFA